MKQVFKCSCSADHYAADACVIWCFDDRFSSTLDRYASHQGWQNYDLIKVAGGAKDLATPDNESSREFLFDQIDKSIKLHHPAKIVLMMHKDCGACGGITKASYYEEQLNHARHSLLQYLADDHTDIEVEMLYVDFEGVNVLGQAQRRKGADTVTVTAKA